MSKKCKLIKKENVEFLKELMEISVEAILGGKYSISYKVLADDVRELLSEAISDKFGISEFRGLCSCRMEDVMNFITEWFPDDEIMEVSCALEKELADFIYHFADNIPKESQVYQDIMEDFINGLRKRSEGLE